MRVNQSQRGSILCKHSGTKTKKKRSGGIDGDSRHYLFNSHNNVRRGMLCISITTRTLWYTTSIVTIVPRDRMEDIEKIPWFELNSSCWIKGVAGLLFDCLLCLLVVWLVSQGESSQKEIFETKLTAT
jgi:hypothetical protein